MDSDRIFVYHIDSRNRITYLNQGWIDFAQENQAPELKPDTVLGQNLANYIADWETRHLYEIVYDRVRRTGQIVQLPFRCDSPGLRRFFQMNIGPLSEGGLKFTVKVIRIEQRHLVALLDNSTERSADHVVICSWCKRVEFPADHWVDLEAVINKQDLFGQDFFGSTPPVLTHDVCPECLVRIQAELDQH